MIDLSTDEVNRVRMNLAIMGADKWHKLIAMLVSNATILSDLLHESCHQGLQRIIINKPRRFVYSSDCNVDNRLPPPCGLRNKISGLLLSSGLTSLNSLSLGGSNATDRPKALRNSYTEV